MSVLDYKILDPRLNDALPAYATSGSAGLDLRACIEATTTVHPGDTTHMTHDPAPTCGEHRKSAAAQR